MALLEQRTPPPFVPPRGPHADLTEQLLADGMEAAALEPPPADAAAQVRFGEAGPMHWIGSELEPRLAGEEDDVEILRQLGASEAFVERTRASNLETGAAVELGSVACSER